ncbi:MAG: ArsA family ATPase [Bdellovibrionaceae bacterium]|nr:ArsA family ATPase [Pseudobdellovibrionaceae bacterium]
MKPTKSTQVIVCIGCGGVGKTTVSASLGYLLAEQGFKTLVLTIDPAKRLATTLGIEGRTDIAEVPGVKLKGQLFASVIDHQTVFNDFIRRASGAGADVQAIFKNRLYQQMSTNLSGSQEFTALEKLYSAYDSGEYDWIVLDTPPSKHAIDFLNAPQKLAAIFNESVAKWFRTMDGSGGWMSQIISSGTKQVIQILEKLTGSEFVKELRLFFSYIHSWQDRLESRIVQVHNLLVSPNTRFFLVSSLDEVKMAEALTLGQEVRKQGYQLTKVIINKAQFESTFDFNLHSSMADSEATFQELQRFTSRFQNYLMYRQELLHKFEAAMSGKIEMISLKEYLDPISDTESLKLIAFDLSQKIKL